MPSKIVQILRHGEKPTDSGNRNLSPRRNERAQALAENHERLFGRLDLLFAAADSVGSVRSRETVTPLAEALHFPIDADLKSSDLCQVGRSAARPG